MKSWKLKPSELSVRRGRPHFDPNSLITARMSLRSPLNSRA
jgi:hypothetical protein